jgi:hypothetical protein
VLNFLEQPSDPFELLHILSYSTIVGVLHRYGAGEIFSIQLASKGMIVLLQERAHYAVLHFLFFFCNTLYRAQDSVAFD